jgi:outer membrane protein OmpA-like peptidoglycan-associated protein
MESAAPVTVHHNIEATGGIISSPPDAPVKPAVQQNMMAAPAVASPHPMSELPAETISEQDLMRDAAPIAPPHAPVHTQKSAPSPAPHVASRPSLTVTPPETPRETPRETTEDRPLASPLPDIKVVHEADNPDVSDPAPVAQPTAPRTPRDEPLTLPKTGKIGKTTAPMLVPAPDLHTSESIPLAPPTTAAPGISNDPAAAAITPAFTQPAAVPTPDDTSAMPSMPTVPTIADLSLGFSGNSSDLTAETQKKLDAVIHQMNEMTDGRLQVRGYATGEDGSTSSARRIALSRALSVRSYLMDKGIKPTRVDVRALGTETERSPLDRVDLIFVR